MPAVAPRHRIVILETIVYEGTVVSWRRGHRGCRGGDVLDVVTGDENILIVAVKIDLIRPLANAAFALLDPEAAGITGIEMV